MKWWCTTNVCLSAVFGLQAFPQTTMGFRVSYVERGAQAANSCGGWLRGLACSVVGLPHPRHPRAKWVAMRKTREWWWSGGQMMRRASRWTSALYEVLPTARTEEMRNRCQVCLALWNQFHFKHDENIFSRGVPRAYGVCASGGWRAVYDASHIAYILSAENCGTRGQYQLRDRGGKQKNDETEVNEIV